MSVTPAEAVAAALAAPLSAKKAMLTVFLLDGEADRLFATSGEDDILRYRAGLAEKAPALALIFALAAMRPEGPRLVTEAVAVPLEDYCTLGVEDFMVSLYNRHTVQRVLVALPDGSRQPVHPVLAEALAALQAHTG